MKPMAILGLVLIAFGVVALVYGGIAYTSRETVLDVVPFTRRQTAKKRCRSRPLPASSGSWPVRACCTRHANREVAVRRAAGALLSRHQQAASNDRMNLPRIRNAVERVCVEQQYVSGFARLSVPRVESMPIVRAAVCVADRSACIGVNPA